MCSSPVGVTYRQLYIKKCINYVFFPIKNVVDKVSVKVSAASSIVFLYRQMNILKEEGVKNQEAITDIDNEIVSYLIVCS